MIGQIRKQLACLSLAGPGLYLVFACSGLARVDAEVYVLVVY